MAVLTRCPRCGHLARDAGHDDLPTRESEPVAPRGDRRRFRCPKCGGVDTEGETASKSEVQSWENEGGSAWGQDEGPWEG